MFCSNCGANLQDGVRFCEKCGCPVAAKPVAQPPVYQQPVYQPQPNPYQAPPAAPVPPVNPYEVPAYQAQYQPVFPEEETKTNVPKLVFSIVSIVAGILAFLIMIIVADDYYAGDSFLPIFMFSTAGVVFGSIGMNGGKKPLCVVGIVFGALASFINFIMMMD